MKKAPDKSAVCKQFSNCIHTYCIEATEQQRIAERMMHLIHQLFIPYPEKALEIGCGSGFFTRKLFCNFPNSEWIINDISDKVRDFIFPIADEKEVQNIHFLIGDAENIHFPDNLDLITSTSAIQWFHHPEIFFKKVAQSLTDDGYFAFSTFGPQNYTEIRKITGNGLYYYSVDELCTMLEPHFTILRVEVNIMPIYFSETIKLLRHIKKTGVNGSFRKHWTKRHLDSFTEQYQHFKDEKGYRLTYHPVYIIAKKK